MQGTHWRKDVARAMLELIHHPEPHFNTIGKATAEWPNLLLHVQLWPRLEQLPPEPLAVGTEGRVAFLRHAPSSRCMMPCFSEVLDGLAALEGCGAV